MTQGHIVLENVCEVIQKFLGSRAPDEVHPVMLKALDIVGLS